MNTNIRHGSRSTADHRSGPAAGKTDEDRIVIPSVAAEAPVYLPLVSTRLAHVLQDAGIQKVGELDGWTYSRLLRLRNCGRKTIEELRSLLANSDALATAPSLERLSVPVSLHAFSPFDLPVSTRLANVFRRNGIVCLGDLHGMPIEAVRRFSFRGNETANEVKALLEAVASSEAVLLAREFSPAQIPELLRALTGALSKLTLLKQEIVMMRLGGGGHGRRWAVSAITSAFGTGVNQVSITLHRSWEQIRILAGPGPCRQLRLLADYCQERVCPLTVPLLSFWLGGQTMSHHEGSKTLAFYLRLMKKLEPAVPAWPDGQCPDYHNRCAVPILKGLKVLLKQGPAVLPCKTAYERLITMPTTRDMSVSDFLDALQYTRALVVRFPAPDHPEVGLRSAMQLTAGEKKSKNRQFS